MSIEQNTGDINYPGTYQDPQSKAILTVTMEPGADALVRLGWVRIEDEEVTETYQEGQTESKSKKKQEKTTKKGK